MATNINTILNWFKTGLKPTQAQFWATLTSYWHKDELIPTRSIEGLDNLLMGKAEKDQFDGHKTDAGAHGELFQTKEDKANKGAADGYVPLDEFAKVTAQYLSIIDDLVTGGSEGLLSAEQGKVLKTQIDAINLMLTSDNVNLDTVQELVDAIETVQTSLSTILVDDLTTGGVTKALTAEQGKVLKVLIDGLDTGAFTTGSGTTNYLPKWLSAKNTGDSKIYDDGNGVGVGTNQPIPTSVLTLKENDSQVRAVSLENRNGTANWHFYVDAEVVDDRRLAIMNFQNNGIQITEEGNVLIGSNVDNSSKLKVAGDGYFEGKATTRPPIACTTPVGQVDMSVNNASSYNTKESIVPVNNNAFYPIITGKNRIDGQGYINIPAFGFMRRSANTNGDVVIQNSGDGLGIVRWFFAPNGDFVCPGNVVAGNTPSSGTYTGGFSITTNVNGIHQTNATYTKIGNIVTVSLGFTVAATVASSDIVLVTPLPFSRANTDTSHSGTCVWQNGTNSGSSIVVLNDTTNLGLSFRTNTTNTVLTSVQFQYDISK